MGNLVDCLKKAKRLNKYEKAAIRAAQQEYLPNAKTSAEADQMAVNSAIERVQDIISSIYQQAGVPQSRPVVVPASGPLAEPVTPTAVAAPAPAALGTAQNENAASVPATTATPPQQRSVARLLADAGTLLVTVLAVRHRSAARTIIVDGGMNTLARPAIYGAHHELLPLRHAPAAGPADIAGPICESTDVLARQRSLPALQRGNLLAICTTGAYGYSMASQYNAQPRPAEVLVTGTNARIIRRRETFADLDGAGY